MTRKLSPHFLLLFLSFSFVYGIIYEVDNLSQFEMEVCKLNSNSLVLFDIDNTLITPKDASLRPCGSYLRKIYLHGLEAKRREWLQSILVLDGEEELMEPAFPSLIKDMQDKRIPVIGFTALETGNYGKMTCIEDWRINRLKSLDMDFSPTFTDHAFSLTVANPYNGYYPLFKSGVLFTNREPKGELLILFLERLGWRPTKIVFMDDTITQLQSVESAANALDIEFIGFHYVAAKTRPCELDHNLGAFQFQYLVDKEIWLPDIEARKQYDKAASMDPNSSYSRDKR